VFSFAEPLSFEADAVEGPPAEAEDVPVDPLHALQESVIATAIVRARILLLCKPFNFVSSLK
jgi:hypothetical protein